MENTSQMPLEAIELLEAFASIENEAQLRKFEHENRDKIKETPIVWIKWDEVWTRVTGSPYFMAVTESVPAKQSMSKERLDPKSRNYRVRMRFKEIHWRKSIETYGKRKKGVVFALNGIPIGEDSNEMHSIIHKITADQLPSF